jgi:superfamily II DNA/RNA helicase
MSFLQLLGFKFGSIRAGMSQQERTRLDDQFNEEGIEAVP